MERPIKRRSQQLPGLLLAFALVLSSCQQAAGGGIDPDPTLPGSVDGNSATSPDIDQSSFTTQYSFDEADSDSSWDSSATTVALTSNKAQIEGSGASFAGSTLRITQAGTYVLTGVLAQGQILVDAGKGDLVRLVLAGLTATNPEGPVIYAPHAAKLVLIIENGTSNTLSDGKAYAQSGEDDADAVIYAQNDLSITGGGLLRVNALYKHGIRSQDILAITSGMIEIDAVGDALRGRDGVAIKGGSFNLVAGGDGIQSNYPDDDSQGFVVIYGGDFSIQAASDGIQAQSSLSIWGGSFQIVTGGGSANAPAHTEEFPVGPGGGWGNPGGGWGGRTLPDSSQSTASTDSTSMKALKSGRLLYIAGGELTIDANDDGLYSNSAVLITGGELSIRSGDDAIHADAALAISGGSIDIPACYEGVEGLSVTINGGDIRVVASDDAINAANGSGGAAAQWGGPGGGGPGSPGAQGGGGPGGQGAPGQADPDCFIRITGGTLDVYGGNDGLDSNGDIYIEGGSIQISGPSLDMDCAIDQDGSLLISGGKLITAGSIESASASSTQPILLVSYSSQHPSGSIITIKGQDGQTLLQYRSQTAFSMSGFSSPAFELGQVLSLYIDDFKLMDITLDKTVTSTADNGGAYSGGQGRQPGRR